ncbi:hypothetical protein MtrunA17_Chr7g0272331 [Medicago truncatula]|uniref:Uncharacterized protein n=1 Tax=Medicago truncatula TaxID=3880 RepID=G7KXK2_MEDTR|nr:hypothetical protein MTR_7g112800 [Medicago truncatula]RHN49233.1 hypothetical protein MtrunA17_Chr7g0272331 [Medicago truncatula]
MVVDSPTHHLSLFDLLPLLSSFVIVHRSSSPFLCPCSPFVTAVSSQNLSCCRVSSITEPLIHHRDRHLVPSVALYVSEFDPVGH